MSAPASRRSCLSVPGSSERKLEKAPGLPADEIVIDLEDAVSADAKDSARAATLAALSAWSGPPAAVRVNAPRTPWCHLDLIAIAGVPGPTRPRSVVVPKVEGPEDLAFLDRLLDGIEAGEPAGGPTAPRTREPLRIQALIETPRGLARAQEIAGSSPRLETLILGYADLGAALGGARDLDGWLPAQHELLLAARSFGLQAIDGPFLGVAVDDPFLAAARRARDLGFDGKWAIHPAQVASLNEIFSPTDREVERARAVIAALAQAERESGQGAVMLDGEMLDEAVRVGALRVLARAGAEDSP